MNILSHLSNMLKLLFISHDINEESFSTKDKCVDLDHPLTENSSQILDQIPMDIMIQVFDYLPFQEYGKLSLVSKKWKNLNQDMLLDLKIYHKFVENFAPKYQEGNISNNKPEQWKESYKASFTYDNKSVLIEKIPVRNFMSILSAEDLKNPDFLIDEAWKKIEIDRGSYLPLVRFRTTGIEVKVVNTSLSPEKKQLINKIEKAIKEMFDV